MGELGRWWPRVSAAGVLSVLAVATFASQWPATEPAVALRAAAPVAAAPVDDAVTTPTAGALLAPTSARQAIASRGGVAYALAGGALTLDDIPVPALAAYQRAAGVINTADDRCHLDWELLAALGKVLSDHGRVDGSALDDKGVARPAVLGERLTGRKGSERVADTDGGQLDRDTHVDRSVGPMMMLPSVWSVVAVDGDLDGRRNPQDVDDAALGAAVFLCAGRGDFRDASHVREEVRRYHSGVDYAKHVLAVRSAYRQAGKLQQNVSLLAREEGVAAAPDALDPDLGVTDPTQAPTWSPAPATPTPTHGHGHGGATATPTPTSPGSSTPTPSSSPSSTPSPSGSTDPSPTADPTPTCSPSQDPTSDPTDGPEAPVPTCSPSASPTNPDPSPTPTTKSSPSPTSGPTSDGSSASPTASVAVLLGLPGLLVLRRRRRGASGLDRRRP